VTGPMWFQALVDQAHAAVRNMRGDKPAARGEYRCVAPAFGCGQPLGKPLNRAFRDRASRAEYDITGLCQPCQDVMFAPEPEEIGRMAADPENFGRCGVCGEYRPYEFVDVGVGVIKGFDCCPPEEYHRLPLCSTADDKGCRCTLRQDHAHGHDFYVSTAGGTA